ncbi:MAG: hypothetical protein PHR32_08345, partial [Candidatus Cloacimonetes bacterium]|nr:hypothetical protein [Candidatus Cloacimonadota bacterium]
MAEGEQNIVPQRGQELPGEDQTDFIFLDYGALHLPDTFFFDYDHLNGEGARFFSQIIDQLVNRK